MGGGPQRPRGTGQILYESPDCVLYFLASTDERREGRDSDEAEQGRERASRVEAHGDSGMRDRGSSERVRARDPHAIAAIPIPAPIRVPGA